MSATVSISELTVAIKTVHIAFKIYSQLVDNQFTIQDSRAVTRKPRNSTFFYLRYTYTYSDSDSDCYLLQVPTGFTACYHVSSLICI